MGNKKKERVLSGRDRVMRLRFDQGFLMIGMRRLREFDFLMSIVKGARIKSRLNTLIEGYIHIWHQ
jgi:hypothetical protein